MMLGDLSDLHETLFAMRLLREEILDAPVTRADGAGLSERILSANGRQVPTGSTPTAGSGPGRGSGEGVVGVAIGLARDLEGPAVAAETLSALAAACGDAAPRRGPGLPVHGTPAPSAARSPALFAELLETINGPVAVEVWPPPVRAFALHFLLRLVQPFSAPPGAVAFLAEALLLAADGFAPDRMLLAAAPNGVGGTRALPDPAGFVRARAHAFVEALGRTRDLVRGATARGIALASLDHRSERLNPRQRRIVEFLAEAEERSLPFRAYVRWNAGRRAPSLRTLQRDWQQLREGGWIDDGESGAVLRTDRFAFG